MKVFRTLLTLGLFAGLSLSANAAEERNVTACVFDITGANGINASFVKDLKLEAKQKMNVNLDVKIFTDEKVAAENFKVKKCDGMGITGLRARAFVPFTGSLDSLGAIKNMKQMKTAVQVLAKPGASKKMSTDNYDVAGIIPLGPLYFFVNDRDINHVSKLSGKRITVLDFDKSQALMVKKFGAVPVSADMVTFANKFNNGNADMSPAPPLAYKALELYKGMGEKGGVADIPLAYLTYQFIFHKGVFTNEELIQLRKWSADNFDVAAKIINDSITDIPDNQWIRIPADDMARYDIIMRDSRVDLRDKGFYDPSMMKMLKKLRCKDDATRSECSDNIE